MTIFDGVAARGLVNGRGPPHAAGGIYHQIFTIKYCHGPLTIKCISELSHDLLICIPVPDRSISTNLALSFSGFSVRMRLILPAASGSLATI